MSKDRVLASVASLDDVQTIDTIEMLLDTATSTDVHVVCVLNTDDDAHHRAVESIPQCEVVRLPMEYAYGPCYARHLAMMRWRGEQWYLSVDAHTRFETGWDAQYLEWSASLPRKHVLSTYVSHDPKHSLALIEPTHWGADGILHKTRREIGPCSITSPIPARFLAFMSLWAPSSIIEDCMIDPFLCFIGEEQTYSLRLWTHGYDLFHPPRQAIWNSCLMPHTARFLGSPEHPKAHVLDRLAKNRAASLFGHPAGEVTNMAPYGLGTERTLAQWYEWSGCEIGRTPPTDAEWRAAGPGRQWYVPTELRSLDHQIRHCAMPGAFLNDAKLQSVDFSHSNLRGVSFEVADLRNCQFRSATLTGANFRGADLRGADFHGASVAYADFTGAQTDGADFTNTHKIGAIGLDC